MAIGVARKELIAVDEAEQRHRLAAQRVDDMAIIDDMAMFAVAAGAPAHQRDERGAADEQVETVVVKADPQPVPDQPRRHCVEHSFEQEAA